MTDSKPPPALRWYPEERRLSSGDQIFIVTDIHCYSSRMVRSARDQQWFRVGAVNLKNLTVGYWRFSIDDAQAILRARIVAPPWTHPLSEGIQIERARHVTGKRMGRYKVTVTTVSVPPEVIAKASELRAHFTRKGHQPNFVVGAWAGRQQSASRALAVENAAMRRVGIFKANRIKVIVGAGINVTPVLARLVEEGRLTKVGAKKYVVTPPKIIDRADWTD
ncbi:MAG: hypothetical protein WDO69_32605 [Pseudomonadota bacterium]